MPKPRSKHDAPPPWPTRWMARALGLTPHQLSRLVADGTLSRGKVAYGAFDPVLTTQLFLEHLAEGDSDDGALTTERIRLLRGRASLVEHELAVAQRTVERQVARHLEHVLIVGRQMLLGIAGHLAPRLALAQTPQACFALVDNEVRAALTAMSEFDSWDPESGMPVFEDGKANGSNGKAGAHDQGAAPNGGDHKGGVGGAAPPARRT